MPRVTTYPPFMGTVWARGLSVSRDMQLIADELVE
jgi:hypothetical protein